jgi:hypothetical protein
MSGNYPPGAENDPRAPWNEPVIEEHEHQFFPIDSEPILEDGKAILHLKCDHVTELNTEQGYDGERIVTEGIPCEAGERHEWEASYMWYPNGQGAPIPDPSEEMPPEMEHAMMMVEQKGEIIEFDDDPAYGHVKVAWDGYKVVYR